MKEYWLALLLFVGFLCLLVGIAFAYGYIVYKKAHKQSQKSLNASLIISYLLKLRDEIESEDQKNTVSLCSDCFEDILILANHLVFDFDSFISNIKIEPSNISETTKKSIDSFTAEQQVHIKELFSSKFQLTAMILCYNLNIYYDESVIQDEHTAIDNLVKLLMKKHNKLIIKQFFFDNMYKFIISKIKSVVEWLKRVKAFNRSIGDIHESLEAVDYYRTFGVPVYKELNQNNKEYISDKWTYDYDVA